MMPDSRAGVQANVKLMDSLNFVGQVTSRTNELIPDVQWAYFSYKVTEKIDVEVGRKRIPMYYFSQFQDVGFAYPWVIMPQELYGWEVQNYNGVTAKYHSRLPFLFNTNLTTTAFYGQDTVKNSKYMRIFSQDHIDVSWKDIIGGDAELTKDWWTLRAIYLQSNNSSLYKDSNVRYGSKMNDYGVAFNGDFDDWFFFSEATLNVRTYPDAPRYSVRAAAALFGVGYKLDKWTPFVSVSKYKESSQNAAYDRQGWISYSAVLRYDLTSSSSVKAQFNYNEDLARDFTGNASVIRISYDMVF